MIVIVLVRTAAMFVAVSLMWPGEQLWLAMIGLGIAIAAFIVAVRNLCGTARKFW